MFFNLIKMRLQTNNKLWQNVTMYYTISINVFIFLRIVLLFSSIQLVSSFFNLLSYHLHFYCTVWTVNVKGGNFYGCSRYKDFTSPIDFPHYFRKRIWQAYT